MEPQKLVQMANQIGAYFEAEPDSAEAVAGIAGHLRRFWEPRMRTALYAWLDGHAGLGLAPLVLRALEERRAELCP